MARLQTFTLRFAALGLALTAIISCDQRVPTGTIGGGGGGGNQTGTDVTPPIVTIDTPSVGSYVNIGDSVLVAVRIRDNQVLQDVGVTGVSMRGSADLGNLTIVTRYNSVGAPAAGTSFPTTTRDTVIRRWMKATTPVDTTQDSVVFTAIGRDAAGLADTARLRIKLVAGPKVGSLAPAMGDSVQRGILMNVVMRVTSDQGISRASLRIRSMTSSTCPAWVTPIDTTVTRNYTGEQLVDFTTSVLVPANAPGRG